MGKKARIRMGHSWVVLVGLATGKDKILFFFLPRLISFSYYFSPAFIISFPLRIECTFFFPFFSTRYFCSCVRFLPPIIPTFPSVNN
ncbi:hypothetical protein HOY80DRAFT_294516 [Tuber brumale]|nr:hypothetical protein HOY80DRAFT_294516 [Tuber brumale]